MRVARVLVELLGQQHDLSLELDDQGFELRHTSKRGVQRFNRSLVVRALRRHIDL
jgi:hypothetical protein